MNQWTERKFLTFPLQKQHKKCAEHLRYVYEKLLKRADIEEDIESYKTLLHWMKEEPFECVNLKTLADHYHYHLQQALQKKKEHHLLPSIRQGDREYADPSWPINIYLDYIRSAHNVGSILRTVEAFRLGSVYFSLKTPFISHKQVQDTSMGATEWIVCNHATPLKELIRPIIVMETSEEAMLVDDFIFPESFTLVVGNEEYGCSDEALQLADYLIEIPLRGHKNSLNVANAFAIVAGEISRQRRLKDQYDKTKNK